MKVPMRWILLPATLVVASLAIAARASTRQARRIKAARESQADSVREWENEGGALATGGLPGGAPAKAGDPA